MVKVFLAHKKSDEEATLKAMETALREVLHADSPTLDFSITLGRDDYNAHIARLGSWNEWSASITARYDAIIVPGRDIGKATMQILNTAFAQKRPVLLFEGGRLIQVGAVMTEDPRDFVAGWRVAPAASSVVGGVR